MRHAMSNVEVIDAIGRMVAVLNEPDPDPEIWDILMSLPLDSHNVRRIVGAMAVRAAGMTLEAAGLDTGTETGRVRLLYAIPPDDISDHAKAAAELVRLGCDFLIASPDDEAEAEKLQDVVWQVVHRGPAHAFLVLGEIMGHIRRIVMGDLRGVIRA